MTQPSCLEEQVEKARLVLYCMGAYRFGYDAPAPKVSRRRLRASSTTHLVGPAIHSCAQQAMTPLIRAGVTSQGSPVWHPTSRRSLDNGASTYAEGSRRQLGGASTNPSAAHPTARSAMTKNSFCGGRSVNHRNR